MAVNHATLPSAAVNDVITSRVQNVCVRHVEVTFPNIKSSFHSFCHFGNIDVHRVVLYKMMFEIKKLIVLFKLIWK